MFDANRSRLCASQAKGHRARTGHELTGYYVTEPQNPEHYPVSRLVLTCPCGNSNEMVVDDMVVMDAREQPTQS